MKLYIRSRKYAPQLIKVKSGSDNSQAFYITHQFGDGVPSSMSSIKTSAERAAVVQARGHKRMAFRAHYPFRN